MKRQLFGFLLLLLFVFTVSAQEKEAQKIDKLNSDIHYCEVWMAAIDNFFSHLQKNPQAKGFFIYYEGSYSVPVYKNGKFEKKQTVLPRYGEANARMDAFRHFMKLRQLDKSKVLFINGGYKEEFTVEFWLVPRGSELPETNPTLDKIQYRKGNPPDFYCHNL